MTIFLSTLSPLFCCRFLKKHCALMLFACSLSNSCSIIAELIYFIPSLLIKFCHFLLVNNNITVLTGYDPWRAGGIERLVLRSSELNSAVLQTCVMYTDVSVSFVTFCNLPETLSK